MERFKQHRIVHHRNRDRIGYTPVSALPKTPMSAESDAALKTESVYAFPIDSEEAIRRRYSGIFVKDGVGHVNSPKKTESGSDDSLKKTEPGSDVSASPFKNDHSSKYSNFRSDESESDDENVYKSKPNRVGYTTTPSPQPYYKTSKPNGNDYVAPPLRPHYKTSKPNGYDYIAPPPQPYYETSKPNGHDYIAPPLQPYYETSKPNGNDYLAPPIRPYYDETSNKFLPRIKPHTLVDRPNKATLESNSSISTEEAVRRYGGTLDNRGNDTEDARVQRNKRIIEETRRRRYGGATAVQQDNEVADSQEKLVREIIIS